MKHRILALLAASLAWLAAVAPVAAAQPARSIVVASTTSTQDSGLFEFLLPQFTAASGITVKVVAQGTGQALDTARRGDADVGCGHAAIVSDRPFTNRRALLHDQLATQADIFGRGADHHARDAGFDDPLHLLVEKAKVLRTDFE